MTADQFIIENSNLDIDLVHVPQGVDLGEIEVEKILRTGGGFVYPDSVYFEPTSGWFFELITLDL